MEFPEFTFLTVGRGTDPRTARNLSRNFAAGRLVRLRRGVYIPIEEWLGTTSWGRYAASTASLGLPGPAPVFCRETALSLHGFSLARVPLTVEYLTDSLSSWGRRPSPRLYGDMPAAAKAWGRIQPDTRRVLPTGFRDARRPGAERKPTRLSVAHLGVVLPLQRLEAVLLDTLHRMAFPDAIAVVDAIAARDSRIKSPCSLEGLAASLAGLPSGAARDRTGKVLRFADPAAESVGESFSRAVIEQLGFEVPESQFRVMGPCGEVARTDFYWRSRKLVGEFEGIMKYSRSRDFSGKDPAQVVVEEKVREDRIRAEGYQVVRWVWGELMKPELLRGKLLRAGVPRR